VATIDTANVSGSARSAPPSPAALSPASTVSPAKAPSMKMSPCEKWITSSTPKKSVNPTATRAYITPSITPFHACWRTSSRGGTRRAGYIFLNL